VVALALGISLNAFIKDSFSNAGLLVLLFSVPLAYLKVYRPSFVIHNLTELFIYPGIAAVFVPIFNVWTVLVLLVIISIYDMWAVWHSGIMQKMAKFQMKEIKVFSGFFIPYMTKQLKEKLRKLRLKKGKSVKAGKNIRISLAILGGGDVVFPIITAGVFMVNYGILPALFVIFGAFSGLFYLFSISQKKKFYPAMPFISGGIFLALLLWWLVF
jgi:presenilin-like A22 family membrane protease